MQREISCESRVRVEDERVRRSDVQQTDVAEKVDGEVGSEDVLRRGRSGDHFDVGGERDGAERDEEGGLLSAGEIDHKDDGTRGDGTIKRTWSTSGSEQSRFCPVWE